MSEVTLSGSPGQLLSPSKTLWSLISFLPYPKHILNSMLILHFYYPCYCFAHRYKSNLIEHCLWKKNIPKRNYFHRFNLLWRSVCHKQCEQTLTLSHTLSMYWSLSFFLVLIVHVWVVSYLSFRKKGIRRCMWLPRQASCFRPSCWQSTGPTPAPPTPAPRLPLTMQGTAASSLLKG